MKSSSDITFIINESKELHDTMSFSPWNEIFMERAKSFLQKMVGLDSAEKALQNQGE